jgi:hypothetical protein
VSPAPEKRIEVGITADTGTEIVVTDANRARVGSDAGRLSLQLPPGLYKARFKAGSVSSDRVFEVVDKPVHLSAPSLEIRSPVPLAGTATTHEYQEDGARALSHLPPEKIGAGSEIALFARDSEKRINVGPPAEPWRGLVLQRLSGIADVDFSATGTRDPNRGFGASRVELDPGAYLLTLERKSGPVLQLPVVASAGWRTTVFVNCAGTAGEREPDLYAASAIVSRLGEPFEPYDEVLRFAELAKQSLAQGRVSVDAESLSKMLHLKFEYPMVGILAGHLMLLSGKPSYELLCTVVDNLEKLVPGHPDVLALRVALIRDGATPAQDDLRLAYPPMLRSSWDIFVEASSRMPLLLPVNAEWMKYAHGLCGSQLWLTWQRPPVAEAKGKGFMAGIKGIGKSEWDHGFASVWRALRRDEPREKVLASLADLAKSVFVGADGRLSKRLVASVWNQFRHQLADPSIAASPLQNALRRKLLSLLDDSDSDDDDEFTLAGLARDLRVPVPVLIEAAHALFTEAKGRLGS